MHVDEHDSDFFFDAAQSRVARKDAFCCAPAYVQAEGLSQFLFIPELKDHLVEFTKQPTKFIRTPGACATEFDGLANCWLYWLSQLVVSESTKSDQADGAFKRANLSAQPGKLPLERRDRTNLSSGDRKTKGQQTDAAETKNRSHIGAGEL
jgi:hypothetical protein